MQISANSKSREASEEVFESCSYKANENLYLYFIEMSNSYFRGYPLLATFTNGGWMVFYFDTQSARDELVGKFHIHLGTSCFPLSHLLIRQPLSSFPFSYNIVTH